MIDLGNSKKVGSINDTYDSVNLGNAKKVSTNSSTNQKEDGVGFFEKAYNNLFEKAQSLGELILGDKANKKAPPKPAILDSDDDVSTREVFLKNASKQLYGTTPQTLSDDPFAEHTFLRNVRQVAASQEKVYKETLKSDLPWEEKSKQLTKLNEDYSKPYLDEKNRLNKQLEEVNSKLEKLKNISKTIQTQQEYTGKDYTYYPYKYEEDKLFEQKSKEGLTLSDVGNEEATLLKVKKDLESKLSENEKDRKNLQKTLTSPAFYINPVAELTRNNPEELLSLNQQDFGFQLAKMQAEVESMDNEEKKQGRLYPYNASINGKEIKDLLSEKVVIYNTNLFNWTDRIASYFRDNPGGVETEYIEEKLGSSSGTTTGGVIRKIQEDAYNGANSLKANINANKKSYSEIIKNLQDFKLEQLKKAKEENKKDTVERSETNANFLT